MRKEGHLRRGYFAFSIKDTLDDTIRDLDSWQRNLLDPSWYQLVLVPGKRVSQLASQRVSDRQDPTNVLSSLRNFANVDDVDPGRVDNALLPNDCVELLAAQIEFSESKLGIHKPSGTLVVMDAVHMPAQPDTKRATEEVLILLRRLSSVDVETFGFLHCRGALQNAQSFDFIFSFPKDFDDPTSLRRLLINADVTYPLNARVNLGQMLARSVAFLHTCHLVHKNVRPENIICFSTPGKYPDHPYLVGLERFRFIDAYSLRVSDDLWQRNIYRHPSRQGTRPERDYLMQHDIYSLGVCLLEIGLWKSFVTYNEDTDSISANEDFILPMHLAIKDPRRRAFQIKMNFTKLAQERLPGIMGQRYAGTVISCLTCLDPGNSDFGDESAVEDSDGILVGIRYIEKVRSKQLEVGACRIDPA